jgi:suppressor of ftsI
MTQMISFVWRFLWCTPSGRRIRILGFVAVATGSMLLAAGQSAVPPVPFSNPPILESQGGILDVTLTVAPATVTVAGKTVTTTVYNGLYMPPVLKTNPGDTIQLHLINANTSPSLTNVHYHGFGVSPQGNGDNVFIEVEPGAPSFDYNIPIPLDHPQGLYWYHPHFHPGVNQAIAGGLSGGIIIGNILQTFPKLQGITERIILLKDLKLDKNGQPVPDPDPAGSTIRTINGLYQPEIDIAPGELQFWRFGNIGANIYYKLKFKGKVPFYIIGIDGNLQNQIIETRELVIPPASRYEVLVRGPKKGKYKLHAEKFSTGPGGDTYPHQVLATLVASGDKANPIIPLPTIFPSPSDLSGLTPNVSRQVVFNDTSDPNVFVIDNEVYDHNRIDQTVRLGDLEEWTVRNASKELHVFHIHQTDFQVTEINGVRQPFTGYQDTVSLPIATKKGPGEVKIRIRFTNPLIVGKFVYHCHIVQHADQGMMANIEVVDSIAKLNAGQAKRLAAHASHRRSHLARRIPGSEFMVMRRIKASPVVAEQKSE